MALIVEDGTGKVDAESFVSVAEATTYHTARGNAAWAALANDTIREQLLRKATAYMQQAYRARWQSFRVSTTQALDWPRAWVKIPDAPYGYGSFAAYVPNNVVPLEVRQACAELALTAIAGDLAPALGRTTSRERVGDIDVAYEPGSPEYTRYRAVDLLLAPYLVGSASYAQLVRA